MINYTIKYKSTTLVYEKFPQLFFFGLSIVYDENDKLYLYVLEFPGLSCRYNMDSPGIFKQVMFDFVKVLMKQMLNCPSDEALFEKTRFFITLFTVILDTGTALDQYLRTFVFKLLNFCRDIQVVTTHYSEKEIDGLFAKYEGLAQCLSL